MWRILAHMRLPSGSAGVSRHCPVTSNSQPWKAQRNPQFNNERLGFPTQRSMEVMYYNSDWLKQLGYNEAPKDWKTWQEGACKASDPASRCAVRPHPHDGGGSGKIVSWLLRGARIGSSRRA